MVNTYLEPKSRILKKIRKFFDDRGVLEVITPLIRQTASTNPYIKPIKAGFGYLQTSPEYAMKELLANGSGCIYQICKAFRDDEVGSKHNIEFTMLEWYRVGFNLEDLIAELEEFFINIAGVSKVVKLSYKQVFKKILNFDPFNFKKYDNNFLIALILEYKKIINLTENQLTNLSRDDLLNIIFGFLIEPSLNDFVIIYNYPETQAELAKIETVNGVKVAKRFEIYYKGLELANGYYELQDKDEQLARFERDCKTRQQLGLEEIAIDVKLLSALDKGLPECSGVALGVDRLFMTILDVDNIDNLS